MSTAFALPAAVAMHPPAPQVYRRAFGGLFGGRRIFSQLTTMALRHVLRHPVRSTLTAVGIAFSVALVEVALGTMDSVEAMLDAIYFRTDRQDATLAFNTPRPPSVVQRGREPARRDDGGALSRAPGAHLQRPVFPPARHHRQAAGNRLSAACSTSI